MILLHACLPIVTIEINCFVLQVYNEANEAKVHAARTKKSSGRRKGDDMTIMKIVQHTTGIIKVIIE